MTAPAAQRHYRAPCPNCGAPVVFQSAQSTHAICAYCRSTVVREGEALRRIGQMAELFEDHSPLQLGTSGRIDGQGFVLVGRLQYQYGKGVWTEWHALLDDGGSAWLSEDNGAYVFSRPYTLRPRAALPAAAQLQVGKRLRLDKQDWRVSSKVAVRLRSAQGELPRLPAPGRAFTVAELRAEQAAAVASGDAAQAQLLSIDYGDHPPALFAGRAVELAALSLTGLKAESAAAESPMRQFACPHCGSPVQVKLVQSQSITCQQCKSLIDLSQGLGGELDYALQALFTPGPIALGSVGRFKDADWQVVGYQRRRGRTHESERFEWSEYLLYNAGQGFCFLVHSEEGWSLVRPITDAPKQEKYLAQVRYQGRTYRLESRYSSETIAVLGEFYWPVARGQRTQHRDFAAQGQLLSMEQSADEITWSHGERLEAKAVASAFGVSPESLLDDDAGPLSSAGGLGAAIFTLVWIILIFFWAYMWVFSSEDEGYSRSSGAAYGGYRLGGGHK